MEAKLLSSVAVSFFLVAVVNGRPVEILDNAQTVSSDTDVAAYLQQYGYSVSPDPSKKSGGMASMLVFSPVEDLASGIKKFQDAFGLPVTGVADAETLRMMSLPRCSMSDDGMITNQRRKKRYILAGTKWNKTHLTFSFHNYSPDLPRGDQEQIINTALKLWERASPLRFTYKQFGTFDILIKFVRGEHGDGNPFDGVGGFLAHAYYPKGGGDVHFDDTETWTQNGGKGVDLLYVATHELGHSLGLAHSRERRSIMFPSYMGYNPNLRLHQDDIDGINALYRPSRDAATANDIPRRPPTTRWTPPTTHRTTTTTTTPRTTTTTTRPPRRHNRRSLACDVRKWDSVVTTADGNMYFFVGEQYYKRGDRHPTRIADTWSGLRGNFNSAFTTRDGTTYLTQNNRVFTFRNTEGTGISVTRYTYQYFRGIPEVFDAAFTSQSGILFVVKGSQFWRYNERNHQLDRLFPRDFNSAWQGAPETIDAATTDSEGHTHFFYNSHFYTYDNNARRIVDPRSTAHYWFGC